MTYNVYRGGENRFPEVLGVIRDANPDILAIQEACGWRDNGRLAELGEIIGIPNTGRYICPANPRSKSGRIFDIAFYSRYQSILERVWNDTDKVWHVIPKFQITVGGRKVAVIPVHLSPKSEDLRLLEVGIINEAIRKDEDAVLLGDLNSLSPNDQYASTLEQDLLRHKIVKFGNPPQYNVIARLGQAGWNDALSDFSSPDAPVQCTVHEGGEDKDHLNLRLDYVMVTNNLVSQIVSTSVIDTPAARLASDHLPVVTVLDI